jgi:D-methionine transport system ATP-binding protein
VLVNGKDLSALTGAQLRTERRAIGTIFQSSALLRRKTAAQNVALPLEYLGVVRAQIDARVAELLDHVGIADKANFYPGQLSGGQRQRVGIARALALHPQVLLSDEATSGLDPQATESILALVRRLRDEFGLSIILITHEMDVVRTVADRVAVLRAGRIVESGSVRELIANPHSTIGRQLLPMKPIAADEPGLLTLDITYSAHTRVPSDWISLASEMLNARVHVLGGIVEQIDDRAAGRFAIGLSFAQPHSHDSADSIIRYLHGLGLVATLRERSDRTPELTSGAA